MGLKKHVPNLITSLNLLSGSIAVIFAVQGNLVLAAIFVAAGIFFDFFDGLAARALDVKSEVGLQMDSLADVVTSGVVPGIVMYQLIVKALPSSGSLSTDWDSSEFELNLQPFALIGLLIIVASAYRLAKFNVDDRQTDSFIGLPTPANALLILSLPLILTYESVPIINQLILNEWFLVGLTILSCILLNAELPLFALKFSDWGFKENKLRYFFIVSCLLLIVLLKFIAIPAIILLYVLLSVISNRKATA
ncbi:CDP-alcohol phosphatidyltransferase family protein [Christiangramia sp. OXR-203]|jgi:CDP-diacylglycerol--serine O-phosphatidyltransferase|uniref:CDP-alcohol phosphatidyltransferase family protein n=1 Tax=Christiangramia sp. OXR-203 TaxID=3100176 RepID=UPI002AC95645|nr:CDP-alcohol phosphatidyltransferase family protein [Christiangramia sp. OXR-203]WPY97883.1 CDP-alcohol phosphatidyltransferase family protein [Christiangramia sp. OXR-203]